MVIYILCHCMLEACNLLFILQGLQLKDFGLLNSVETEKLRELLKLNPMHFVLGYDHKPMGTRECSVGHRLICLNTWSQALLNEACRWEQV